MTSCPHARGLAPALDAGADEVLGWLLGAGHLSLLDVERRPLGERASPLYERAERVEQVRSFGDARDATGLPCNVAALRQLTGTWGELLAALGAVDADAPADHHRLLRRAERACALAPLAALRPRPPALARPAAALFKVCLGFREVLATALMEGRIDADAPVDAEALLELVDARGFLIGDAQVCAGSRAQIRQALTALAGGASVAPAPLRALVEPWLAEAADALLALQVLAACAAGAARALLLAGAAPDHTAVCVAIYMAEHPPRLVEVLRQIPGAGPLHPTLLYRPDAVAGEVRAFLARLEPARSFADVDAALGAAAAPAAARLFAALGREAGPMSPRALERALR